MEGLKYLQNVVSYNTELYNAIKSKVPTEEGKMSPDMVTLLNIGMGDCVLKIKEAVKTAKGIFGEEILIQEDIQQISSQMKPPFYLTDNKLFFQNGNDIDETIAEIERVLREKENLKKPNGNT